MEDIGRLVAVHGVLLVFASVLLNQLGIRLPVPHGRAPRGERVVKDQAGVVMPVVCCLANVLRDYIRSLGACSRAVPDPE